MSYKTEFQANNVDLQGLIDTANALPDHENLDSELATQDTLIADIMTALEGKTAAKDPNIVAEATVTSNGSNGVYVDIPINELEPSQSYFCNIFWRPTSGTYPNAVTVPFSTDSNGTIESYSSVSSWSASSSSEKGNITTNKAVTFSWDATNSRITITSNVFYGMSSIEVVFANIYCMYA